MPHFKDAPATSPVPNSVMYFIELGVKQDDTNFRAQSRMENVKMLLHGFPGHRTHHRSEQGFPSQPGSENWGELQENRRLGVNHLSIHCRKNNHRRDNSKHSPTNPSGKLPRMISAESLEIRLDHYPGKKGEPLGPRSRSWLFFLSKRQSILLCRSRRPDVKVFEKAIHVLSSLMWMSSTNPAQSIGFPISTIA